MTSKASDSSKLRIPVTLIERRIYLIRGQKVMIDTDLAELYGVPTFRLNEAVKRNRKRFPSDFMFQLRKKESESLTSQFAISKKGRGGRRTLPYVFTEQGVAMKIPFRDWHALRSHFSQRCGCTMARSGVGTERVTELPMVLPMCGLKTARCPPGQRSRMRLQMRPSLLA